jgi:hypothetical protein
MLTYHLRLYLPSGLFYVTPPNYYMHLFIPPHVPHVPPISFSFIWLHKYYLERSFGHEAPHYAVSSTPLLPRTSRARNVFLVTLGGETLKRFFNVGHSYNTISEAVRNPINYNQKRKSDDGGFI